MASGRPVDVAVNPISIHTQTVPISRSGWFTSVSLRHAAANVGLAILFFGALLPGAVHYGNSVADVIWIAGAILMGVFSLVRVTPRAATVNAQSVMATALMIVPPMLVEGGAASLGVLANCAIAVELAGIVFSQTARLYLGRRFGLLPANRGIITSGPFRIVRHPNYLGWLILSLGYLMAYPAVVYALMIVFTLPIMMWRIGLEENLLMQDPTYRAYCETTRYRLIPGLL
jgi:protein-S-isoprenylcysteine O-methyltransferase Ste14